MQSVPIAIYEGIFGSWPDAFILVFTGHWWLTFVRHCVRVSVFRGGYPTLVGSKCLGCGELRRPAGDDRPCLLVRSEVSRVFWVPTCPPEIRSHQYGVLQQSGSPPFPPCRRRGQQLPPCLYIDDSERSLCQYGPELIRGA